MGSLGHIYIAIVLAQGHTNSVFIGPRGSRCIPRHELYTQGVNITCHDYVSGFTNQGK